MIVLCSVCDRYCGVVVGCSSWCIIEVCGYLLLLTWLIAYGSLVGVWFFYCRTGDRLSISVCCPRSSSLLSGVLHWLSFLILVLCVFYFLYLFLSLLFFFCFYIYCFLFVTLFVFSVWLSYFCVFFFFMFAYLLPSSPFFHYPAPLWSGSY